MVIYTLEIQLLVKPVLWFIFTPKFLQSSICNYKTLLILNCVPFKIKPNFIFSAQLCVMQHSLRILQYSRKSLPEEGKRYRRKIMLWNENAYLKTKKSFTLTNSHSTLNLDTLNQNACLVAKVYRLTHHGLCKLVNIYAVNILISHIKSGLCDDISIMWLEGNIIQYFDS